MKLTPMQRKVYDYLRDYQRAHGFIPAVRDICAAMNLKSSSTAHFHLKNLEKAGLIAIEAGKSRAITLLEIPDCLKAELDDEWTEADADASRTAARDYGNRTNPREYGGRTAARDYGARTETQESGARIPILGAVAAGSPILAQERVEGYLTLDISKRGGAYFALRVRGESMLNAGIFPGDYVIVRQQPEANHGEIVVALIGDEATVKRYSLRNGHVWLLPENDAYSPIDGANAQVLGIVTAVWRTYERV